MSKGRKRNRNKELRLLPTRRRSNLKTTTSRQSAGRTSSKIARWNLLQIDPTEAAIKLWLRVTHQMIPERRSNSIVPKLISDQKWRNAKVSTNRKVLFLVWTLPNQLSTRSLPLVIRWTTPSSWSTTNSLGVTVSCRASWRTKIRRLWSSLFGLKSSSWSFKCRVNPSVQQKSWPKKSRQAGRITRSSWLALKMKLGYTNLRYKNWQKQPWLISRVQRISQWVANRKWKVSGTGSGSSKRPTSKLCERENTTRLIWRIRSRSLQIWKAGFIWLIRKIWNCNAKTKIWRAGFRNSKRNMKGKWLISIRESRPWRKIIKISEWTLSRNLARKTLGSWKRKSMLWRNNSKGRKNYWGRWLSWRRKQKFRKTKKMPAYGKKWQNSNRPLIN